MFVFRTKTTLPSVARALNNLSAWMVGGGLRGILSDVGKDLLAYMRREYRARSRKTWPRIGVAALLVSRGRVKRQIKTWEEARRRAANAQPLLDTGQAYSSLLEGAPHNVFVLKNTSVTVGSTDPVLVRHQRAHAWLFRFDPEAQAAFDRNVSKSVGGKWNPDYFKMRRWLASLHLSAFGVPARPLPNVAPPSIRNSTTRRVVAALKHRFRLVMAAARINAGLRP